MAKPTKAPLVVRVVKGRLSISIGIDTLAFAVQAIDNWPEEFGIADKQAFAKDVARELNREDDVGSTPVHLLLDKMAIKALDGGSLGVVEKETPAHSRSKT